MFPDPCPDRVVENQPAFELDYKPWWSDGLFFSCLGCGRCCRGDPGAIWVSDENIAAASDVVGLDQVDFRRIFVTRRWKRPSLREKPNGDCVMYERESARCMIYDVRPLQCLLFPFWPSILESARDWEKASTSCPGIGQGRLHASGEIAGLLARSPFRDL